MFLVSVTVPFIKTKSEVFFPLELHMCSLHSKLQWGQQWPRSHTNGVCMQHLQPPKSMWHAAFPPNTLEPSTVFKATAETNNKVLKTLRKTIWYVIYRKLNPIWQKQVTPVHPMHNIWGFPHWCRSAESYQSTSIIFSAYVLHATWKL